MRQVGFMCFMMWMMGSGIQIFSIFMVISGLAAPVMAIYKSGQGMKVLWQSAESSSSAADICKTL